ATDLTVNLQKMGEYVGIVLRPGRRILQRRRAVLKQAAGITELNCVVGHENKDLRIVRMVRAIITPFCTPAKTGTAARFLWRLLKRRGQDSNLRGLSAPPVY